MNQNLLHGNSAEEKKNILTGRKRQAELKTEKKKQI